MNHSSDEPPLPDRIRTWTRTKAHANFNPFGTDEHHSAPTLISTPSTSNHVRADSTLPASQHVSGTHHENTEEDNITEERKSTLPPPAPPPLVTQGDGEGSSTIDQETVKLSLSRRFLSETKRILFSSLINWLLVFVPIGIVFGVIHRVHGDASPITPTVIFAVNAVAIIPLAGLLSFATESVAVKLGDTVGALMNVTFGNAVELIIFIIALAAKEIRIVQASILGSILANLLLILGMAFLVGGLRFREQLYNSTVSQMSACLLSLSVISLLLPTAFHASFSNSDTADRIVVKVSRGTSVVLLLVYVLYLLFQLKSHAYMYESTPQHLIDEESHPGVLADMLNSSSSSDSSSNSSSSDSDGSSGSHTTAKRIRRALRRKRRKSNASSKDSPSIVRSSSTRTHNTVAEDFPKSESPPQLTPKTSRNLEAVLSGDEADTDGERDRRRRKSHASGVTSRDFESEKSGTSQSAERLKKKRKAKKSRHSKKNKSEDEKNVIKEDVITQTDSSETTRSPPQVGFVNEVQEIPDFNPSSARQPFTFRSLSVRPALPKALTSNVFTHPHQHPAGQTLPLPVISPLPGRTISTGVRHAISLPEIMHQPGPSVPQTAPPVVVQPLPHLMPANHSVVSVDSKDLAAGETKHLSRTSAAILLLVSTGLVAVCAEFLVESIDYLVENTGVSQAFIGLIILPIVGNAAEHVTAVVVASKNKMDLAIGVALGSSIQIALFVTPVIVLLGWALGDDMSLYFSLFETISLFASTFIVNYLMIDGRSNYLEGAMLIAAYVIISVAAFFYPGCESLSLASGSVDSSGTC